MKIDFDHPSSLEIDQSVVDHNLTMMRENMKKLAISESMGGNASMATIDGKEYVCVGLNGYADKETGRILAFGNFQNIPKEIIDSGAEFTLREALNLDINEFLDAFENRDNKAETIEMFSARFKKSKISKIVNFFGADGFSEKGRKNIQAAIDTYNADHWV